MDNYIFTFNHFSKGLMVDYTATITTKKISETAAKDLLITELCKRGKSGYCYSVQKGGKSGPYINLLGKK